MVRLLGELTGAVLAGAVLGIPVGVVAYISGASETLAEGVTIWPAILITITVVRFVCGKLIKEKTND